MSNESHFLSGRANDETEVQRVLDDARDATGVVLYFHGGLSSAGYVEEKLGRWLLRSAFQPKNMDGLHTVFVQYDAGLFDWTKFRDWLAENAVQHVMGRLKAKFERERDKHLVAKAGDEEAALVEAARALLAAGAQKSDLDDEEIARLLEQDDSQRQLQAVLEAADPEIAQLAREIEQLAADKGAERSVIAAIMPAKVIVRIAARFALRIHHQVMPTIVEELIRGLTWLGVLERLAQQHWETVYKRTEQCWQKERNGRRLIEGLKALRETAETQGRTFRIHAVSHSAGAIAICRLVAHLAANNGPRLDQIVMIAPAVNQKLFAETVIKHPSAYARFRAFILDRKHEEKDNLLSYAYPASLLYFVSGVAEKTGYGDRMLLIEQHLRRERPYSTRWYRRTLGRKKIQGDYEKVWEFMEVPGNRVFCPKDDGGPGVANDGTEHENTKLLWKTPRLGRAVLYLLTGRVVGEDDIPDPKPEEDVD